MMYCPSCAGHVNAFTGEITTVAPRTDTVSTIIAVYVVVRSSVSSTGNRVSSTSVS